MRRLTLNAFNSELGIGKTLAVFALALFVLAASGCRRGPDKLNVLLLTIDTLRADHLGNYGYDQGPISPNLDRLAAHGVAFERVISPAPLTLPAHASILTGLYPPRHGVHDNLSHRLPAKSITLAEFLRDRGYDTAGFVSSVVLDSRYGIDQGFQHYDDDFATARQVGTVSERVCEETVSRAISWLEARDDSDTDPFFLFVHLYDPHDSYVPPSPHKETFANSPYAGEVAYADACSGELLDALESRSLMDETVVVVTGDHGEMLGEHGEQTHSFFIYQSALSVPLIWRLPEKNARRGERISETVSLVDIFPTILSLLGFAKGAVSQGETLLETSSSSSSSGDSRAVFAESVVPNRYYGAAVLFGVVTDRWKYIHTSKPELYDLDLDPAETTNLIEQQPRLIEGFESRLEAWLAEIAKDGGAEAVQLDEAARAELRSLGYLGDGSPQSATSLGDVHGEDAKDLIDFYQRHQQLEDLTGAQKWPEAHALASELVAERPSFKMGFLQLARLERELGNPDAAVRHYESALAVEPSDLTTRLALADQLRLNGELTRAAAELERALEQHPDHREATLALAGLYAEMGKGDVATRLLVETIDGAGDTPDASLLVQLGTALAASGELEEAKRTFRRAIDLRQSHVDARVQLASVLIAEGNAVEAESILREADAFEPQRPDVQRNLGLSLRAQGKLNEAVNAFEAALRLDPDYADAHNNLGVVHKQQGDLDAAKKAYERALALDPQLAEAHNNLGSLLGGQGKMPAAMSHFRQAIAAKPDYAEARNNLGLALRMAGNRDEALEHFRVALESRPDWPKPMSEIAWILTTHPLARKRSPSEGVRLAERAAELTRHNEPIILDTLAAAYASSGQFDKAVQAAEAALKLAASKNMRGFDREIEGRLSLYRSRRPFQER